MGSRYGGLKQLDAVGPHGETIIDYAVFDAVRAGFNKVVFIIRPEIEAEFKQKIGTTMPGTFTVDYVSQELSAVPAGFKVPHNRQKPWGTAHALLSAREVVREPFLIINADDFYGKTAFQSASDYIDKTHAVELQAALVGYRLKNTLSRNGTVSRGLCSVDSHGTLNKIEELHGIVRTTTGTIEDETGRIIDEDSFVSMNMWIFTPTVFHYAEQLFTNFLSKHINEPNTEFYIPDIVDALINQTELKVPVLETEEQWYGVTYQEDKPDIVSAISKMSAAGRYPETLWSTL